MPIPQNFWDEGEKAWNGFFGKKREILLERLRESQLPWMDRLTEDEKDIVIFAVIYSHYFNNNADKLSDGKRLLLITKLAKLLDEKRQVSINHLLDM